MKKLKMIPSVLMLALCVGILGIGIYAAAPTTNLITGSITVNAANATVKVQVFKGDPETGENVGEDSGRTTNEVVLEKAIDIDASKAENLSQVQPAIYTVRLSTTSDIKLVVDTETIEWRDGTTTDGTITDALKITKVHTPPATDDTTGIAYFNKTTGVYDIQCSINLTDLYEENFTSELDLVINVYKLDDWVEEGNTGINGIDYLNFGQYPQSLEAEFEKVGDIEGYTLTSEKFYGYNESNGKKEERQVYSKDGESDGSRYVCQTASVFVEDREVQNEWGDWEIVSIYKDVANLYKIEPLKWRIIDNFEGGYTLLCCVSVEEGVPYQQFSVDIDGMQYAVVDGQTTSYYANNYSVSTLRNYLTDTFYNNAFGDTEKSIVKITRVSNSAISMGGLGDVDFSCEDTEDPVFALCYMDVDYGWADAYWGLSDYSSIRDTVSEYTMWLRSPDIYDSYYAMYKDGGNIMTACVNSVEYGCVPAMNITL